MAAGAVFATGIQNGTTPVTVNLGTGFQYLVVAYDGPQGSVAVFNVAGLTGSVDLYRYAKRDGATGNLIGSNVAGQGLQTDDRLDATQPNRRGSRWRNDRDVARGGTRCAWYGATLFKELTPH